MLEEVNAHVLQRISDLVRVDGEQDARRRNALAWVGKAGQREGFGLVARDWTDCTLKPKRVE